ncbi:hypothetical protein ARMSODRAFT_1023342 [Armillaria solidipes]|uniref:Uncharacterized protein n=1 Tax=Armillaria solidipes TaxID=1076256 RepID=A0A2H3BJY7_9AGAR|nr:hypothetical protein ARMSODRAFT_1023342 [Armillaria solidipes]
MLNGNIHTNKNKKNTDPNDVSLVGGHAFFPDQEHYREIAAQVMAMVEEKSICNFLWAVNNQNTGKWCGMKYTGVFATVCKHTFIESMVNLISGEKFGFIDEAVFHAFESTNYDHAEGFIGLPELMSFDCGYQYSINMLRHFEENYPK